MTTTMTTTMTTATTHEIHEAAPRSEADGMTDRTRHLRVLTFGEPDRIPLIPGWGRESTRARWYREGLPREVEPGQIAEYAYRQAGGCLPFPRGGPGFQVNERMIPHFEEKVLERRERSQVVQDWKGNVCEISNEFDVGYLRNAIDFVTRRWIKCPVENRADWADMRQRYDSTNAERLPDEAAEKGRALRDRGTFLEIHVSGPYWQLREWLGFEQLSMMFYDDPVFIQEMLDFWQAYIWQLLQRVFAVVTPDCVHISEDMAYKGRAMLSPEMTRTYLLPVWKRWGEAIRGAGVPLYAVDSDGYIEELIPQWLEAGMNCCDPIEVAAGNDIVRMHKRFGRNMAYRGGVDKREIARGGVHIERELARIATVIRSGGFIPGCDHGVPSDVSWPAYVKYVAELARHTGWMD